MELKAYVLLIASRPSDGDVKSDGSLGAFEKSILMPAPGLPFESTMTMGSGLIIQVSTLMLFHNFS